MIWICPAVATTHIAAMAASVVVVTMIPVRTRRRVFFFEFPLALSGGACRQQDVAVTGNLSASAGPPLSRERDADDLRDPGGDGDVGEGREDDRTRRHHATERDKYHDGHADE